MRTNGDFFNYLSRVNVHTQVENDIRILTKKNKKRTNKITTPKDQVEKDTYEQAMDTSKYDKILNELTI